MSQHESCNLGQWSYIGYTLWYVPWRNLLNRSRKRSKEISFKDAKSKSYSLKRFNWYMNDNAQQQQKSTSNVMLIHSIVGMRSINWSTNKHNDDNKHLDAQQDKEWEIHFNKNEAKVKSIDGSGRLMWIISPLIFAFQIREHR